MSPKKNKDAAVRSEMARQLDMLAELLIKQQVVQDVSPLNKAAAQCRIYPTSGKWGYSVENLIFRRLGNFKVFQNGFDIQNAALELSVIIEGFCINSDDSDPLTSLGLGIVVSGVYEGENNAESATVAWHLDRHIYDEDDKVSDFMHPIYHFSFGGIHLEKMLNPLSTSILLADTPRISYPPMDAILGIDFVITNFIGGPLLHLRNDGFYLNVVSTMQKSLWKPYISSLHSCWATALKSPPWSPKIIWPQLILP